MRPGSEAAIASGKIDRVSSFDELFSTNYAALARLVFRVTGDTSVAEELASEAFWRLHRNPPRSWANVEGWLYRTALRMALNDLRAELRRSRYETLFSFLASCLQKRPSSPEQVRVAKEEQEQVRVVLNRLSRRDAELLLLRNSGLSYGEIADSLHLKQSSVGTLLSRAEQAFRKEFIELYGE